MKIEGLEKLKKTIKSSITQEHLEASLKMILNNENNLNASEMQELKECFENKWNEINNK